jgi:hypothetical protein
LKVGPDWSWIYSQTLFLKLDDHLITPISF